MVNSYHETALSLIEQFGHHISSTELSIQFIDVHALTSTPMSDLIHQYLTERERIEYQQHQRPLYFAAKRIASKMAFFDIYHDNQINRPDQLEIEHYQNGCPYFTFDHKKLNYALSISDEAHIVAALCCKRS